MKNNFRRRKTTQEMLFGRYFLIKTVTPSKKSPCLNLTTTSSAVARVGFREVFLRSIGTAVLMLGFAFFRQIAAWFMDGVALSGADFGGGPFGAPATPVPGPRQTLWAAPAPTAQPPGQSTRASGIDLNEFR